MLGSGNEKEARGSYGHYSPKQDNKLGEGKRGTGRGGGGVDPSGPTNTTFKRHTFYKCPVGCWLDI